MGSATDSTRTTADPGPSRPGRRPHLGAAALLTGGLLVASVALPAAASVPAPGRTQRPSCGADLSAPGAAAAARTARECGSAVEVLDERTEFNTTYAQPDGTSRLVASAVAVRARVDGAWAEIDSSLVPSAAGLAVAAAVSPMTFSDGSDGQPLATIERDGDVLSFDVPFDLPSPQVGDGQLVYTEVLPGVDLVLTVSNDTTSFTEVLRVRSPRAAADPRLTDLRFPVTVSDGLHVVQDGGGFQVQDRDGDPVFSGPPPTMWDSREPGTAAGADRAGVDPSRQRAQRVASPIGGEKVRPMQLKVAAEHISVAADRTMLQDPATVWPVYIDPSISGTPLEWTAVRDVYAQQYKFAPDAGTGLCSTSRVSSCDRTHKSRVLWEFGGLQTVGGMAPDDIISATFAAVGTHSYSCTAQPVALWRIGTWDGNTAWPGSFLVPQSTQTVAHKSTCTGQPVRWIEWPALEAARSVAADNTGELALALAADETTMEHWKRYRNDATLSIVYNRPPDLPSQVQLVLPGAPCVTGASRPVIRSTSPTIAAVHTDPDGLSVRAGVDVNLLSSPVGAGNLFHGNTQPQASGTWHDIVLGGLSSGNVYRAKLWTVDDRPQSSGFVFCEFEVDTQVPNVPTVSGTANGSQPVYPSGVAAGGVGQTGTFHLGNNGSGDVTGYKYSVAGGESGVISTPKGAIATLTVTPRRAGTSRLTVESIDHAGNVGPPKSYDIVAAWPQKVAWKLDETSGATAASTSTTVTPTGTTTTNPLPLTVSPSLATRVGGFLAATSGSTTDRALNFDGSDDTATTTTAAVDTAKNFTVSAAVRPTAATGTATALSQDGVSTAAFQLGYRPCATGTGSCWSFSMSPTDSTSAVPRAVVSTIPVQAGEWTEITGVHDAGADTLQLWVCHPVPDDFGDTTWTLTSAGTVSHAGAWSSTERLQLGRARGTTPALWSGAVGEVRVADGVLSEAEVRRTCPPVA